MATHHGKEGVVKVGANVVAEVSDFTFNEDVTVADDSEKSDAWETHLIGRKKWTASVTCHWDPTDTNGQIALRAGASVTLSLCPEGTAAGGHYVSGTGTILSSPVSSPLNGTVQITFQVQGNGAAVWSTF